MKPQPLSRFQYNRAVNRLNLVTDEGLVIGLLDAFVKVPGETLANQVHSLKLVTYCDAINLIDTAHAVHYFGPTSAGQFVAAINDGDVRPLIKSGLQAQVHRVRADETAGSGAIIVIIGEGEQHRFKVALGVFVRLFGPIPEVLDRYRPTIASQQRTVKDVVHGPLF